MIGSSGSHSSSTLSLPTSHPSATSSLEHRVSVFPFSQLLFFLWRATFYPTVLPVRAALSSVFFLVNCHESSSLFWPFGPLSGCLGCCPLGGNRTVPWPLVWDSWPPLSFALPDQPPPPDHRENHLIWVDLIPVIPLAWSRMSLECLVGSCKFPTTLMTLSLPTVLQSIKIFYKNTYKE